MKTNFLPVLCFFATLSYGSVFATEYKFGGMTTTWDDLIGADTVTTDADYLSAAGNTASSLTIEFSGADVERTLGSFELGFGSTAPITVNFTKGILNVGDIVIGNDNDATAENTVTVGKDATLAFSGQNSYNGRYRFDVGHRGKGTLIVDGGLLTASVASGAANFNLGGNTGAKPAEGLVRLVNGGRIENGTATSFNINIASATDSIGTLEVEGAGSLVAINGTVSLGNQSIGSEGVTAVLNVKDGGVVKKNDAGYIDFNIGASKNSSATVNISGEGSLVQYVRSNAAFRVGGAAGSTANVNVSNGGVLELQRGTEGDMTVQLGTGTAGEEAKSTAKINVNDGGTLLFSEFNGSININTLANSDAGIFVNRGGTMKFTGNGSEFKLGRGNAGSISQIVVDGGSVIAETTGNVNFVLNDDSNGSAYFVMKNGATMTNAATNMNFEVGRHGYGELRLENGAKINATGGMNLGYRNKGAPNIAVGKLIIDNAEIAGRNGISSAYGDLSLGAQIYATGDIEVLNGGKAFFWNVRAANADNAADSLGRSASISIRGLDSSLRFQSLRAGFDGAEGNSVSVLIGSGAQLQVNDYVTLNNTVGVTFALDSAGISVDGTPAMFVAKTVTISGGVGIAIDGAGLGWLYGGVENQAIDLVVAQFSVGATVTLDGTAHVVGADDAAFLAALKDFIKLENNTGNIKGWNDFSLDDLSFEDGKLILSTYYVPEPSAFAAFFGVLAAALAFGRRRRA